FFPPSKTTNLRNDITRFRKRFDESFSEAWDRFNDLLRACPHHGFFELHQLDTFYNALTVNDQDSLNSAAAGNFLDKMPADCLKIIEGKSKVLQTRAKAVVAKVILNSSTLAVSADVAELKDMVKALLLDKKNQYSAQTLSPAPAPIKAVEPNCVTYGGTHAYQNCPATCGNVYQDNIQEYVSQAAAANYSQGNTGFRPQVVANQIRPHGFPPVQNTQNNFNRGNNFNQNRGSGTLPGNTVTNPKEDLKGITTRSGVAYQGPTIPTSSKVTKQGTETSRALIDVHKGELTLRIRKEAITYNLDQTSRYFANYDQMTANKIDVTNEACEEYSQEVFGFFDVTESSSPTPSDDSIVSTTSPTLTPFGDSDFLLFEEADAFLAILNSDPSPPFPNHEQSVPSFKEELKACEAKTIKSSIDEPPETKCCKGVKTPNYVLIGRRATLWLKKKKLTEAPILIAPNWDQPFELMCDASDFAIGAVLGQRIEKHLRPIHYASKTMTHAEKKFTTIEKEMLAVVYAFEKFRSYLIMNKTIVYTDHSALKYIFSKKDAKARLLRWILLLQEFNFKVIDTKGAKNYAASSRIRFQSC
nr:reverse transcriptase domain-containing protein [Tanacetum cinerariifolium]